jgi:hypothetical protein
MTTTSTGTSLLATLAPSLLQGIIGSHSEAETQVESLCLEVLQDKNDPAIVKQLALQIIGVSGVPAAVAMAAHVLLQDAANPSAIGGDVAEIQSEMAKNTSNIWSQLKRTVGLGA